MGKYLEQLQHFYQHLRRHHCTAHYLPMLVKCEAGTPACCPSHTQNFITINTELVDKDGQQDPLVQFRDWWTEQDYISPTSDSGVDHDDLCRDFLLRSIMVLATSLQEIFRNGIKCSLFLLRFHENIKCFVTFFILIFRPTQKNLLIDKNPKFAIITGNRKSGKSFTLELGKMM